jgi:inositol phosphorylceramide synthase catalytic subunit
MSDQQQGNMTNRLIWVAVIGVLYFGWFGGVVGLRSEHIVLFIATAAGYLAGPVSRRWVFAFAAFLVYWMLYDSLRVCPNYTVNPVHIAEPYMFDKQWFGVNSELGRQTWNEYWAAHTSTGMDLLTAFFYLTWVPGPMLFAVWLWRNNKPLFVRFSYGYLFTNLIGFVIYYLYPAAPPWYVEINGFVLHTDTARSAAGLDNVDRMLGIEFFHRMYQRNSNVFAAIPSLHSAYPFITLLYARISGKRWAVVTFTILSFGIWFSAVYLRHHYVIDVLLGILTAIAGFITFETLTQKTALKGWYERLIRFTTYE